MSTVPGALATKLDCWVSDPPPAVAELELILVKVEDGTPTPFALVANCCCYCCLLNEWIEVVDGIFPFSSLLLTRLSLVSFPFPLFTAAEPPVFLKLPRRPLGSFRILRSIDKCECTVR